MLMCFDGWKHAQSHRRYRRSLRGLDCHGRPRAQPAPQRASGDRAARAQGSGRPAVPARDRPVAVAAAGAHGTCLSFAGGHQSLPAHAGRQHCLCFRLARAFQRAVPRAFHRQLRPAPRCRGASAPWPARARRGLHGARASGRARSRGFARRAWRARDHVDLRPVALVPCRLCRHGQSRRGTYGGYADRTLSRWSRGPGGHDCRLAQLSRSRRSRDGLPASDARGVSGAEGGGRARRARRCGCQLPACRAGC